MPDVKDGQSFDSLFQIPRGYVLLPIEEFRMMAQAYYGGMGPVEAEEPIREVGLEEGEKVEYDWGRRPIVRNIGIDGDNT